MRLQQEEGLDALLPLRSSLTALAFTDCLLLTDAAVARLAPLRLLRRLSVNCARLGQAGVDALAGAMPQLSSIDLRLQDGATGGESCRRLHSDPMLCVLPLKALLSPGPSLLS